jgi:hypothetical protein
MRKRDCVEDEASVINTSSGISTFNKDAASIITILCKSSYRYHVYMPKHIGLIIHTAAITATSIIISLSIPHILSSLTTTHSNRIIQALTFYKKRTAHTIDTIAARPAKVATKP